MGYYAYQSFTIIKTEGRLMLAANSLDTSVEVVDALARNVGWLALKMTIAYFALWGLSLSYLILLFAGIKLPVWFAVICSTILAFRPLADCVLIWKSPMYLGPGKVGPASPSSCDQAFHAERRAEARLCGRHRSAVAPGLATANRRKTFSSFRLWARELEPLCLGHLVRRRDLAHTLIVERLRCSSFLSRDIKNRVGKCHGQLALACLHDCEHRSYAWDVPRSLAAAARQLMSTAKPTAQLAAQARSSP